jgi:hypothetical protein
MDFLQLSYFVEVAEQLSFTKAAAKLSVSQPALSRQISGLENEFGIKLFARSSTGISLTEEGRFALDQARDLLYHYRIMSDTMTGIGSKGKHRLALGCSTMLDSIHGSNIFTSYLDAQDHQIKCYEGTTRSLIMMTAILNIDFSVFRTTRGRETPGQTAFYSKPEDIIPLLPYIYCCHAKLFHMSDDFHETEIPYEEVLKIMIDHNWNGYLLSEYEGSDKYDQGYEVGQTLRKQHIMMKRILGD